MDGSNFYRGNPKHGTQAERAATAQALSKLQGVIAAARAEAAGEPRPNTCGVFDDTFGPKDGAGARERRRIAERVALYLSSWVEPLLDAANESMHGGTTLDQRMALEDNLRELIMKGGKP